MKTKLQNPGQIASISEQRKQTVKSCLDDWVESYARVNLRPASYSNYKRTIANYINPYIGGVALNQLTPAIIDKMFQQIIDSGLKHSTAAGAKRVLSVALGHARKYRYIETNAAKDTLTKFGESDKTPDPYTPGQVKALMQSVEGTVWAPLAIFTPPQQTQKETPQTYKNIVFMRVCGVSQVGVLLKIMRDENRFFYNFLLRPISCSTLHF